MRCKRTPCTKHETYLCLSYNKRNSKNVFKNKVKKTAPVNFLTTPFLKIKIGATRLRSSTMARTLFLPAMTKNISFANNFPATATAVWAKAQCAIDACTLIVLQPTGCKTRSTHARKILDDNTQTSFRHCQPLGSRSKSSLKNLSHTCAFHLYGASKPKPRACSSNGNRRLTRGQKLNLSSLYGLQDAPSLLPWSSARR